MKYAVNIGSGAIIYAPTFIKFGSDTHKLTRGIHIRAAKTT
jgi:hypothetical protein